MSHNRGNMVFYAYLIRYVMIACDSLKIVLKNFGPVIKANLTAPPSVGVDITREER